MTRTIDRAVRGARILSDPLRADILAALQAQALTVSELAARLGVPQPRVSSHLALLRAAGWVESHRDGRQRRYRLAADEVTRAIDALAAATSEPTPPARPRRPGVPDAVREARTCYDHLAGVAGVEVCAALAERGWIAPIAGSRGTHQPGYRLTAQGRRELTARGVTIPEDRSGQRRFAYACPDWTEAKPHLGGALGAAILAQLEALGVVCREPGTRAVTLGGDLTAWLGREQA